MIYIFKQNLPLNNNITGDLTATVVKQFPRNRVNYAKSSQFIYVSFSNMTKRSTSKNNKI